MRRRTAMKKLTCISLKNPLSYLACYGIKDVDSRSERTEFRGRVFVQSAGRVAIRGMPALDEYPLPVINEFNRLMDEVAALERRSRYIAFREAGISVYLKNERRQPRRVRREYNLLSDVYHQYHGENEEPFFRVNAIVGSVELVEVCENSESEWADREQPYHWVFADPKILKEPILEVSGQDGVWEYELSDLHT